MNDPFEHRVKDWLAERGAVTAAEVDEVAGRVAELPDARIGLRRPLASAAAVAVAIGLGALLVLRPGFGPGAPSFAAGDPERYRNDPRLTQCGYAIESLQLVFEMASARHLPLHFPGWWKGVPELDVDQPALVAIQKGQVLGGGGPDPVYVLCIAVGPPGSAAVHEYGPTRFDEIRPVLTPDQLALADRLDPDVYGAPEPFLGSDRYGRCTDAGEQVQWAFEMTPALDFPRHFPAAGRVPELEVDDVAFVAVLEGKLGPQPGPSGAGPEPTLGPNERNLCVVLGSDPATYERFYLQHVDVTGFRVKLDTPVAVEPSPTPSDAPAMTPEPAPAWAGDASIALTCTGPVGPIDGTAGIFQRGTSPTVAVAAFLEDADRFGYWSAGPAGFPLGGFEPLEESSEWALWAHRPGGRVAATILIRRTGNIEGGPWIVNDIGACDPSEFHPGIPISGGLVVWTDDDGSTRISTTILAERSDCFGASALTWAGRLYVRDPTGRSYDPAQLLTTYEAKVHLPEGAERTGFRERDRELWATAVQDAVYVASPETIERWPRVRGDLYARTVCN